MRKGILTIILLLFVFSMNYSCNPSEFQSPFCTDYNATKQSFKNLCDFINKEKSNQEYIYVGAYYMRSLVAGYKIFGNQEYLDTAIEYADYLLEKQSPKGYWATGYGDIYLADTGSALGLFIVLYKYVDEERKKKFFDAIKLFTNAIKEDDLINPSGAIGTGWRATKEGKITGTFKDEYTISSGLTGAQIFTWMYHMTKEEDYRRVAINALRWIMSTMREDGVIPYVNASLGSDLNIKGDLKNDYNLWDQWPYDTATYVGEGIIAFDLYCDQPQWKEEIRKSIKPHIEFLLRTQNQDGSWAVPGSLDQKRSPGVVNLLIWYYDYVNKDKRIIDAVRKFDKFLLTPEKAVAYGMLNSEVKIRDKDGNVVIAKNSDIGTGMAGRAIADMILPGVDTKW